MSTLMTHLKNSYICFYRIVTDQDVDDRQNETDEEDEEAKELIAKQSLEEAKNQALRQRAIVEEKKIHDFYQSQKNKFVEAEAESEARELEESDEDKHRRGEEEGSSQGSESPYSRITSASEEEADDEEEWRRRRLITSMRSSPLISESLRRSRDLLATMNSMKYHQRLTSRLTETDQDMCDREEHQRKQRELHDAERRILFDPVARRYE